MKNASECECVYVQRGESKLQMPYSEQLSDHI